MVPSSLCLLGFGISTPSVSLVVVVMLQGTAVKSKNMKHTDKDGGHGGDCGFESWYVAVCHSEETNFL